MDAPPGTAPRGDMVHLSGGTFTMGSDHHYPEEAPAHKVSVDAFWVDRHAVTNTEFSTFVAATGYVTFAERPANPDDYPGADPQMLVPSSVVFRKSDGPVALNDHYNWWAYVPGADWRHPRGPDTTIADLGEHPVVHVTIADAEAYAAWAGKQLPTEAEWEFAARGGLEGAEFVWGEEFMPDGKPQANTWQGEFPWQNTLADGYEWTAPVDSYAPNGYGLFNMAGNTWEWTTDWFQNHSAITRPCCTLANPRGGERENSHDPRQPSLQIPRLVMKGGSHLCAPSYCRRYRPAARMAQQIDTSTSHLGFRCIVRG
jgi:formylglycine-generating enzyme